MYLGGGYGASQRGMEVRPVMRWCHGDGKFQALPGLALKDVRWWSATAPRAILRQPAPRAGLHLTRKRRIHPPFARIHRWIDHRTYPKAIRTHDFFACPTVDPRERCDPDPRFTLPHLRPVPRTRYVDQLYRPMYEWYASTDQWSEPHTTQLVVKLKVRNG